MKNKFNISISETDTQDIHQTSTISIASIVHSNAMADRYYSSIINFIEIHSEAEIIDIQKEVL